MKNNGKLYTWPRTCASNSLPLRPAEYTAIMLALVADVFQNKFDKSGEPYFNHCYAVMSLLPEDSDEELKQIALGHDLFEDTHITRLDLEKKGFSMTKHRGQSYEEYKEEVKANPDSILVKMADLTHNSDIRRIKGEPDQKDFERTAKYRVFYNELKQHLTIQRDWKWENIQ